MRTRLSLFLLVTAGPVVAAQGPLTSSLVSDPKDPTSISTRFTTIRTTVIVTRTSPTPIITAYPSSTTTTTLLLPPPAPGTTTITIHTNSHPPSSRDPSNPHSSPSRTLVNPPTASSSGSLTQNPGALAGLVIGLCVVVAGLLVFAWFTIKRHRLRELEAQAFGPPEIGGMRRNTFQGDIPPGHNHSRIIDDDPDLEVQSSIGNGMRHSSIGHGLASLPAVLGPGENPEQRAGFESGYLATYPTAASSNGHSSHGHGTINTHNSSHTQVYTSTRNTSPTIPWQVPNRTRFSLSPDRTAVPSAWHTSRSEAPTRRGSVDDTSIISYNPHRVSSEPAVSHDTLQYMSIYPRRLSSDIPRPDAFPYPGPPILVHAPLPNPPSSLLRPPSATQVPTLQTLQRSQPSGMYLDLPFLNEPLPSPAASNISVLSGREGLLSTPPHHPTASLSSFRDDRDYSRPISVGVVSGLRDSLSMAEVDSDSEVIANRDSTH